MVQIVNSFRCNCPDNLYAIGEERNDYVEHFLALIWKDILWWQFLFTCIFDTLRLSCNWANWSFSIESLKLSLLVSVLTILVNTVNTLYWKKFVGKNIRFFALISQIDSLLHLYNLVLLICLFLFSRGMIDEMSVLAYASIPFCRIGWM